METFMSFVDTVKAWIYKCSLVVFLINLYTNIFPIAFLTIVGCLVCIAFIIDIISFIVSIFTTTSDGEWTAVAIISLVLNLILLILLVLMFLFPDVTFDILKTKQIIVEGFQLWWLGTCIMLYNTIHEIISFPLDLIALGSDDGDY